MKWIDRPPLSDKHVEERLKLAASGLQASALTLIAAVILGPALNLSLKSPHSAQFVAGFVAGLCEVAAFLSLAYIPVSPKDPKP
jgi:hypothetical protein